MRARYYNPNTGRFISKDPVESINLYGYVGNNPVNLIDPAGLQTVLPPLPPKILKIYRVASKFACSACIGCTIGTALGCHAGCWQGCFNDAYWECMKKCSWDMAKTYWEEATKREKFRFHSSMCVISCLSCWPDLFDIIRGKR